MNSFIRFEALSDGTLALGRPMKMDRQDVVAVYAALREWLAMDHGARFAAYRARFRDLAAALSDVPHVEPAGPEGEPPLGLWFRVDAEAAGKTGSEVASELREGNPGVWVVEGEDGDRFSIRVPWLRDGNEHAIASRLKEILAGG